jgi:hypothetical protein
VNKEKQEEEAEDLALIRPRSPGNAKARPGGSRAKNGQAFIPLCSCKCLPSTTGGGGKVDKERQEEEAEDLAKQKIKFRELINVGANWSHLNQRRARARLRRDAALFDQFLGAGVIFQC